MTQTIEERNEYRRRWYANRKAKKKDESPAVEDETPMDEAVELVLEMPQETPTQPQSMKERAQDWVKSFGSEAPTATKRGGKKKKFFRAKSDIIVPAIVGIIELSLPKLAIEVTFEGQIIRILPTEEQAADIVNPLLNILDRHTNVGAIHPDMEDLTECITALFAYGWEVRLNLKLIERIRMIEAYREQQRKNPPSDASIPTSSGPIVVY